MLVRGHFNDNVGLAVPTSYVDLVVCLPPLRNLEPIKEAGILEGRNGINETCLQGNILCALRGNPVQPHLLL
ncbi:hypothetical protein Dimus_037740 [Dionaea muscipula]